MSTLANSEDPDEMQHGTAFHQDLHCLLRFKTTFRHNLGNSLLPHKVPNGAVSYLFSLRTRSK